MAAVGCQDHFKPSFLVYDFPRVAYHRGNILASHPAARAQFLAFLNFFFDVVKIDQRRWLEVMNRGWIMLIKPI